MSGLKAPEGSQKRVYAKQDALENGNHDARIVRVVDYGVQPKTYNGVPQTPAHKIHVTYELPYELMKDDDGNEMEDKPRWVGEEFALRPLSSDLATSTARSKAIDPTGEKEGDWSQYLSLPCVVQIEVNGIYENVKTVTPIRKRDADKIPELKNPAFFFDLSDPDMEIFNKLPKWQQAKICQNLNFKGSPLYDKLGGVAVTWTKGEKKEDAAPVKEKAEAPTQQPVAQDAPETTEAPDVPW